MYYVNGENGLVVWTETSSQHTNYGSFAYFGKVNKIEKAQFGLTLIYLDKGIPLAPGNVYYSNNNLQMIGEFTNDMTKINNFIADGTDFSKINDYIPADDGLAELLNYRSLISDPEYHELFIDIPREGNFPDKLLDFIFDQKNAPVRFSMDKVSSSRIWRGKGHPFDLKDNVYVSISLFLLSNLIYKQSSLIGTATYEIGNDQGIVVKSS